MIFRRRGKAADDAAPAAEAVDPTDEAPLVDDGDHRAQHGPWDVAERPPDPDDQRQIDLGGLLVRVRIGADLRLQTDQQTEAVTAAMLVTNDGALELRVFAASRSAGLWSAVADEIAADAARRGGTATDREGPYGRELMLVTPVRTPEGRTGTQTSRVVGVDGPRWLLRATYLGKPATEPGTDDGLHMLEELLGEVVVVRGDEAMPPREQIPLRLPPNARPMTPATQDEDEGDDESGDQADDQPGDQSGDPEASPDRPGPA